MKAKKKKTKVILPLLGRYGIHYAIGLVMLFTVDYVNLYIPEFIGNVIDGLESFTLDLNGILTICLRIVICGLIIVAGRFLYRLFIFGSMMFARLELLSQRYYNEHKTGDIMSYFTNDLEAVRMAIGPAIVSAFDASVLTVMVLIRMITKVSVSLTLYTLIPMGVIAIFGYFYGDLIEKRWAKKQESIAALSDFVQESVSGERVIKAFVQEKAQERAFDKVNDENRKTAMNVQKLDSAFGPVLHFLVGVTYVVAIVVGGGYTIKGEMTLGSFVTFNYYIGSLIWPMLALGDSVTLVSQGIAGINRIHQVFDEPQDIVDDPEPDNVTELKGEIEFKDVTFRYREDLPLAVDGVSFKIETGETLAILGRTGSGKTTLVNLLTRVYDIDSGSITLDGHKIKKIPRILSPAISPLAKKARRGRR